MSPHRPSFTLLPALLAEFGITEKPVYEFRFAPPRLWRFDIAFPLAHIACEVDGGIYVAGRHVRAAGFRADIEKLNRAALDLWTVVRIERGDAERGDIYPLLRKAFIARGRIKPGKDER